MRYQDRQAANDAVTGGDNWQLDAAASRPMRLHSGFTMMNTLVGAIYDGPGESPPWRSALHALRDAFEAKHVSLTISPDDVRDSEVPCDTDTVRTDGVQAFQLHNFALDPFSGVDPGTIATPDELLGPAWFETALYREYLVPLDLGPLLGVDLRTSDGTACRIRVARASGMPAFTEPERSLCRVLLPHLQRAIQIQARCDTRRGEQQLYSGVIDRLQLGIIGFDAAGRVLATNREADRILELRDGLRLIDRRLHLDRHIEDRRLNALLAEAAHSAGLQTPELIPGLSVRRSSGSGSLSLLLRSVPPRFSTSGQPRPVSILFLRDSETGGSRMSADALQRRFGLSRMEAALAQCLVDGLTLEESAVQLGLKQAVARNYLRFIFSKTGVTRQTMLVRKLAGWTASLG